MRHQKWLPELADYLLVSQARSQIEHYHRRRGGGWIYAPANEPEESIRLHSVDCTLQLADVYDRVVFPVEEESDEDDEEVRGR